MKSASDELLQNIADERIKLKEMRDEDPSVQE